MYRPRPAPPSPRAHPFVRVLFNYAIALGLPDKELAYRTGFAATTLRNWRAGRAQPCVGHVQILAQALDHRIALIKDKCVIVNEVKEPSQ